MENKVVLIKYADGDEYHLTIEYLQDVAAARKRATELLKECAERNGETVSTMNVDEYRLRAVLTDGTMIWVYWSETIKGGAVYVNLSSDNFGDIMNFGNMPDAIEWMTDKYMRDYNKYAESVVSAELCTRPVAENPIGDIGNGGYYGYIICQDEDADMYYKIIKTE